MSAAQSLGRIAAAATRLSGACAGVASFAPPPLCGVRFGGSGSFGGGGGGALSSRRTLSRGSGGGGVCGVGGVGTSSSPRWGVRRTSSRWVATATPLPPSPSPPPPPLGTMAAAAPADATKSISDFRESYSETPLDEATVDADPIAQFRAWFDDAVRAGVTEPNAMCLSTVSAAGTPAGRYVLLKGVDERGFVWYTNYTSRKAADLDAVPAAALTFWWPELERSVRIEGGAARVPAAESDAYFASRPPGSRLGAWASDQSSPAADRGVMEARMAALEAEYYGPAGAAGGGEPIKDIPRPPHWGGYRLTPTLVEFWKGRKSRVHDRLCYKREAGGEGWTMTRLQP